MRLLIIALLALVTVSACAKEDGAPSGTQAPGSGGTGGETPAPSAWHWKFSVIDEGNTGFQPELARAPDGTLGVAYLRKSSALGTCDLLDSNPPIDQWEIVFAQEGTDGFATPVVIDQVSSLGPEGIALAFAPDGAPAVAYQGGASGAYRCGGSDAMLARRAGASWSSEVLDDDGVATPVFPEDVEACALYQGVCNAAGQDVVGAWPALGFVGGAPFLAFRDNHFGFAQDDEEKSDLELVWKDGAHVTLDASWGGGTYARVVVDSGGAPVLAHHNRFDTEYGRGIWVLRNDGGAWSRQRIAGELNVGYKLALAASGKHLGLAYHAASDRKLLFLEATDGVTWTKPSVVDQKGDTGRSPSLAFDAAGNPALAYYECGPYDPDSSDCKPSSDGLRFAVRHAGKWSAVDVRKDKNGLDGPYASLAFDAAGNPAIAFQAIYFDPTNNEVIRQLVIARGVLE